MKFGGSTSVSRSDVNSRAFAPPWWSRRTRSTSAASVIMMVPCTTTRRDLPSHIEIEPGDSGLDVVSYAKCEDLKSISE